MKALVRMLQDGDAGGIGNGFNKRADTHPLGLVATVTNFPVGWVVGQLPIWDVRVQDCFPYMGLIQGLFSRSYPLGIGGAYSEGPKPGGGLPYCQPPEMAWLLKAPGLGGKSTRALEARADEFAPGPGCCHLPIVA